MLLVPDIRIKSDTLILREGLAQDSAVKMMRRVIKHEAIDLATQRKKSSSRELANTASCRPHEFNFRSRASNKIVPDMNIVV
jgi:hypothetical protein